MLNCRSISPATWEHARQALVFYFSRRQGVSNGEDLAHETLVAILGREDFEFEKEADFLRVCYGFASRILQAARRNGAKYAVSADTIVQSALESEAHGLRGPELNVYLDELLRIGKEELRDSDWGLIGQAMILDGEPMVGTDPAIANKTRVRLHRARQKLARMVGL